MHKTWLEVALNGMWGKDLQPQIPVRVEDIVALNRIRKQQNHARYLAVADIPDEADDTEAEVEEPVA